MHICSSVYIKDLTAFVHMVFNEEFNEVFNEDRIEHRISAAVTELTPKSKQMVFKEIWNAKKEALP